MACESSKCQDQTRNAVSIHKLLFSVGQLKFSLKALMAVQIQNAGISTEGSKAHKDTIPTEDSNRILENVLNEVVASRAQTSRFENKSCSDTESPSPLVSIQELTMTHELLDKELQKVREMYYKELSIS